MSERIYKGCERIFEAQKFENLKQILSNTKEQFGSNPAFKFKTPDSMKIMNYDEYIEEIEALGAALISIGLKDKRIGVISENRYEWEEAYLAITCGTGIAVPLDKALPENEIFNLIERSEMEAIFYSSKYDEVMKKAKDEKIGKIKFFISMDLEEKKKEVYSQKELIKLGKDLIKNGATSYLDAEINNEEMAVMLFTSGTTSQSKAVKLSHNNICSNIYDIASTFDVTSNDTFLSFLPLHHVFECTVGFLFSLYKGAQTVFCDGLRHVVENLKEYQVTVMACVPAIYERIFMIIRKQLEKQGKVEEIIQKENMYKNQSMEVRKEVFKEIHDLIGGKVKLFISGAASLDANIEEKYRLLGINIVQGYGLTETSPVVAIGTNKHYKTGSIGKAVPSVEAKLVDVNDEGIGELIVKGPNVMLGYFNNQKATKEVIKDGWFYTGDLAKIDEEGYIYICGRKKSVIVLKNGKNIFPEEMENLVNKIEGVKESFIFGKQQSEDKNDIKINVKIVFDKEIVKNAYKVETDEEIQNVLSRKIKEINQTMPKYKAIRGIILTEEPLIKTTTNKIKRQENLDAIEKFKN